MTELKYDRFSATSFANFERDLRLVAGQEYDYLFGHIIEGRHPTLQLPLPTSVDVMHEDTIREYDKEIAYLELLPAPRNQDDEEKLDLLKELKDEEIEKFHNLSDAKKKLQDLALQEDYKARVKEETAKMAKYKSDSPKLYWLIRRNMSEESVDKIKEYLGSRWEDSERDQDPVQLWDAIKKTHTAYSTGNPYMDKQSVRQSYSDMKMHPAETLVNMKLRFTTAIRAMESLGINPPTEEEQAADFIAKLDHRWSTLKTQLSNDFIRGLRNQPKTLMEAYQLAAGWKVIVSNPNGLTSTVFATSITSRKTNNDKNNDSKNKNGGNSNNTANNDKNGTDKSGEKSGAKSCYICGEKHFVKDCPFKDEAKKAIETLKNKNQTASTNNQTASNNNQTPAPSATSRTNLTVTPSLQFASFTFMAETKPDNWLKNRILFDPQSQSSSFCNPNFVSGITKKKTPTTITGQGRGEDTAHHEAIFMDMIKVEFNKDFTTNILGGAEMRHFYGFQWGYDGDKDEFWLDIGIDRLIFKMEDYLYTYDPTQDNRIANVFTSLTKAQEHQAIKAHELNKRLGYPNTQRLITALREGAIINAGVSPEDVKRADIIYGKSYPYLAGKSVWRDPDLPSSIRAQLLPETVLEGHTDFMQVGDITALVSVFKPIDLTLLNLVTSKGKEAKKAAFNEQLGNLKGAGFTVKKIIADAGDGYGEALLEVGGPTFEPLPPGRKDHIVEAKIRRIKETMRCLLHSLKFKWNDSILRYSLRCATYYINLFPTREGFKGISPREALTGIKVDVQHCAPIGFGDFAYVKEKQNEFEKKDYGLSSIPWNSFATYRYPRWSPVSKP